MLGANGQPGLWLTAIALVFARMLLGTLDGLAATHYGKATARGEVVNRLAPERCDAPPCGGVGGGPRSGAWPASRPSRWPG